MTTNRYEFRMDGRFAGRAPTEGTVIDEADLLDHAHPRRSSLPSPRGVTDGWTPAHTAAARFLGECFAAGALLGIVTDLARPMWGQRHG